MIIEQGTSNNEFRYEFQYWLFFIRYSIFQFAFCFLLLASSCTPGKKPSPLREGAWRGVLTLNDSTGLILPFNFDVSFQNDSAKFIIYNAEEKIIVDEISFSRTGEDPANTDSVIIRMPVFDSEFRCKLAGDSLLSGNWINHSRKVKNSIPFTAAFGETNRFDCPEYDNNFRFEGKWKCVFSPNNPDSSYAVGVFKQSGHRATGTFLTETGDYRYLEGCVFGKYMLLSCFDGSHAFVFHAEIMEDSTIWGDFYSGIHLRQTWLGWRNDTFQLNNPDSLTFLKKRFTVNESHQAKIDFAFPSIDNKKVSLSDEKYKNKVVVLQIMGSWCPNCADETMFLADLDRKYRSKGLEIIALAFEKAEVFEKAKNNVTRLKKKYHAEYEFLVTDFQPKDAGKALPMLNHVMSFPTTVFIDRKGIVRKIRTGYSGPATGAEHEKFTKELTAFTEALLGEK